MKPIYLVLLLLWPVIGNAQIITTFAGCGTCTVPGDGGAATTAALIAPNGGAFDKHGNYYFAQATGKKVRKVSITGIITTVAGTGSSGPLGDGGPATAANLTSPGAVILDTFGNLYIADITDCRIRKVDIATCTISTIVGNGTGAFFGDNGPATAAEIFGPQDICFDKFGNLYISDAFNYRIRKVTTAGIISTFAGNGTLGSIGDGFPATSAELTLPGGIIADDSGNIYIGDNSINKVRKVNTLGIISTFAGNGIATYSSDGILATDAQINPIRLAIDSSGNLIIADRGNRRVFKVDDAGIIHTIAGNGMTGYTGDGVSATSTSLDFPAGVSFDACWNLYIPEPNNRRVRKVTFNPTCSPTLNINEETGTANISIYPNPTNEILNIDNIKSPAAYHLVSMVGAVMQQGRLKEGSNSISVQSLPAGMYMLEVVSDGGEKVVRKVVKE